MIYSLLTISSIIACFIFLARLPRSGTVVIWFPILFMIQMSILCVVLGIASLFGIGFNPLFASAINLAVALCAGLYRHKISPVEPCGHDKANAFFLMKIATKRDIVVICILLLMVFICSYLQFGFPPSVSFNTSDPSNHLRASINLFQGEPVKSQYLTNLIIACSLTIAEPFIDPFYYYIVFSYTEAFMLLVAGCAFYSLLTVTCTKMRTVVLIALTIFYTLGYPLNNMIFGFSYLGASVTMICIILYISILISSSDRVNILLLVGLSISLFSVFISYVLFVPAIFFGVFIFIICWSRTAGIGTKNTALLEAALFIFPIVLGFLVMYLPVFGNNTQSPTNVITWEGGIFKDLYAGYIFIAPLSFLGIWTCCKKRRYTGTNCICFTFLAFSIALFILGISGKVSSYYFYKIYYVLWLIFFFYAATGIELLVTKSVAALASYSMSWLLVFILAFSGADEKLAASRPAFLSTPIAKTLFPIYAYNLNNINIHHMSADTMELMQDARALFEEGNSVAIVASDYELYWFKALVGPTTQGFFWQMTDDEIKDKLDEFDYILVLNVNSHILTESGTTVPEMADWYANSNDIVIQNEAGKIIKQDA